MRYFKTILLCVYILININANASHIVGGEVQMIHQRGENYLLRLILYYDQANAEFNLVDREIELSIFRKRNNAKVEEATLDFKSSEIINYANPNCLPDSLKTVKITYEEEFRFNLSKYSDSLGYYASWERCCRNNIISNVYQPGRQGMVFKLDFPSLNHYPANSSPTFRPISGEYICLNRWMEIDMSATDINDDSLAYFLDVPLAGFTNPDNPQASTMPGPYPAVEGYYNMPGSPPLSIDNQSGLLSVKPSANGLYVFRVLCIEYRNGKEIGRISREFQILVNECEDNYAPQVEIFNQDDSLYYEQDTLVISNRNELCFNMRISDNTLNEKIKYSIQGLNFEDKSVTFSPESGIINGLGDTLEVRFCWPDCVEPEFEDLYEFFLLVEDNACPVPNTDSTRILLKVKEEFNSKPNIEISQNEGSLSVSELFSLDLYASDPDVNDSLFFSYSDGEGLLSSDIFQTDIGNPINGRFEIISDCKDLREEPYEYWLIVSDNSCSENQKDSIQFKALVNDYIPFEKASKGPSNVITPNGDGWNDYFYFELPPENSCEFNEFKSFTVYNRWGIEVFNSEIREFRWYAENVPSGQYFYVIKFDKIIYKAYLHVIK